MFLSVMCRFEEPCRRSKKQRALTKDAGCFDPYRCRLLCDQTRRSTVDQIIPENTRTIQNPVSNPRNQSGMIQWRCNCMMWWSNSEANVRHFIYIFGPHLPSPLSAPPPVIGNTIQRFEEHSGLTCKWLNIQALHDSWICFNPLDSIGLDWTKLHAIQMIRS